MLKDITTIKLQGAGFDALTSLTLFEPRDGKDKAGNVQFKTIKGSLLYGRNGSGKSTIAKAFRKAKSEVIPTISHVSFLDSNGVPVNLSGDEPKRIYIFDEDFVNNQVKLKEDHLDTIIMLGQAADLEEKIETAEKEMNAASDIMESRRIAFEEYQNPSNSKSPAYCLQRLGNALRGDDAWAGRDRRISGGRQNTQVRDDTYKKFLNVTPKQSRTELIVEFEKQMGALKVAKSGASLIETKTPGLSKAVLHYDDEAIISLLALKIEKPELSEREQYLLKLVEAGRAEELFQKAHYFNDDKIKACPYCYQPVSDDYKANLVTSIEKVLSKAVKEHRRNLEACIRDEVLLDLLPFSSLRSYETCKTLIEEINIAIQNNNRLIQEKIANPYKPFEINNPEISIHIKELNDALVKLEDERIEYNKTISDTRSIVAKLKTINSNIAYYDVKDLADEYDKQQIEYEKAEKAFNEAKTDYETKKKAKEGLEAQKKNVHIALDIINACLKYVFFEDDRLKIEYIDGEYRLFSHGKCVRPCDVSVGERNIIGLSYYFTSIMEGLEEKDVYKNEYLFVIDDPISSYDTENRVGILSFLKYKLSEFLEGNEYTKALIMTHDIMTYYDISKMLEEIVTSCKRNGYSVPPKFNRLELANGVLSQFSNKRHEYTEMLKGVFNYGKGMTNEHDIVIGNMMRQVLEAFATFQYRKGIESISTDPEILNILPGPEYRSYYKNLMYRLVLHGGSHKEDQIKAMQDYDFFSLISESEKRRTAKEVICFIYLLNKLHVLQHLKEIKDAENTLDTWCNEIKSRAAMP